MPYVNLDDPPVDPGLKAGWAKHHLRLLHAEVTRFLEGETHRVWFEDDLEAGEHLVHLSCATPELKMALVCGDFISCLRSSLDHLACSLTRAPGGAKNNKASFPVIEVWDSQGKENFMKAVKGIPSKAVNVIDSLQPYHCGKAYKSTKLWRLNRLWNIDKHRRIPIHATTVDINIRYPADMPCVMSRSDEGSIARFPLAAKGNISLQPPVNVRILFGDKDEGIEVSYEELIEINEFVRRDVFPRFAGFFQAGIAGHKG